MNTKKRELSEDKLQFIARLEEAFKMSPYNKKDIQRALKVSYTTVHNWFKLGEIEKQNAYKLADFLGCDRIYLLTGAKDMVLAESIAISEPDQFLIECVKMVVKLSIGKNIPDEELNSLIMKVYKDGYDTKSINPALINHLFI